MTWMRSGFAMVPGSGPLIAAVGKPVHGCGQFQFQQGGAQAGNRKARAFLQGVGVCGVMPQGMQYCPSVRIKACFRSLVR